MLVNYVCLYYSVSEQLAHKVTHYYIMAPPFMIYFK
jgi:hypothetical protein